LARFLDKSDLIIDVIDSGFVIEADPIDLVLINDEAWPHIAAIEPHRTDSREIKVDPTHALVASAIEMHRTYLDHGREAKVQVAREHGDIGALTIMGESTDGIAPMNPPYPSHRNARQVA
jgi:hypothetical protein